MVSPAEAYDSDSDDESVASTSLVVNGNRENGNGNGMDIDEEDEVESGHRGETEWTEVIPRIRDVMVDKSSRRRDAFISRNLTVSADSPPPEHVPAIVSAILNALPSLEPPQVDSVIAVLVDLVNRDEKLSSEGKLKLGDKLVKWLSVEGGKAANPSRSITGPGLFPYLLLNLALLRTFKRTRPDTAISSELVTTLAIISDGLESRADSSSKSQRFRRKAGIRIWRGLRDLRDAISSILQVLTKSTVQASVLIGHVVGVALRLRPALSGRGMIEKSKDAIINFYSSNILGSKIPVPAYASAAFKPFLAEFVTFEEITQKLLPTVEKMLLRSDIALPLAVDLLSVCPDISQILPGKLVPAALSSAKSSNAEARSNSALLMRTIMERCANESVQGKIVTELLAPLKAGKTSSPEHRVCLMDMITAFPPSDTVSTTIVDTLSPLFAKEGNEVALAATCRAIIPHLAQILPSLSQTSAIVKELASTKPSTRRAVANAVGEAVWAVKDQLANYQDQLRKTLMPLLEGSLKSASANQPVNAAGFLEGFVAIALGLGPLAPTSIVLSDLLTVAPKPSFLLNDKVHIRLSTPEDEQWLLRALETVVAHRADEIKGPARLAIGLAFLHLTFDAKSSAVRRDTLSTLANLAKAQPKATSRIMREALTSWLRSQDEQASRSVEDEIKPRSKQIGRLMAALFHISESAADTAADYIVLAHHPEIGEDSQISWISLVQSVGLDPATVAFDKRESILKHLWDAAGTPPTDPRLAEAAYRAITTLTFIQPDIYLTSVIDRLANDLDPAPLNSIGLEERGIWATPSDQLFVDVLTPKKDAVENKNRKDYANEKWEQEVREALAKKKAATPGAKLSKADQALVSAQMAKEKEVRARIGVLQAKLNRGIELVRSLIAANSEPVARQVRALADMLLGSVFGPGSFLVDARAFAVFLQLGSLASERLGEYRRMLCAAILRAHDAPFVPEDYMQESTSELVTRLLHQLSFVATTSPLDSTTYSLASMLFGRVISQGVGAAQSEEAQEQITLVVNITSSCVGEFSNDTYPRLQTIRDLLFIIATHSKLAKDATAALVDLGASIKDVATLDETKEMIAGTLSKDSNVRNAALQALQPVDITDLDYSEELWIAVHDEDEQNASLALHLWEDNGLDIPETYLSGLLPYLAHDSAAVRTSCAGALAEAAQQFPAQIEPTMTGLEELYADKARLLQPEYDRFGMVIAETVNRADPFEARVAIALSMEKMAPLLPDSLISPVFNFLVVKEALGDRHSQVRRAMLNAGIAIIDLHGGKTVAGLMQMFEDYLGKKGPSSETTDFIKEAVVILFGRLARHLDVSDPRIPQVVDRLVEALNTPSELVQSAVADCLPPLVQGMGEEVEYLVDRLFSTLTTGAKYASRRGAAYGLAGVVKGRGLQSLKEYELMDKLTEAAQDKSAYQARQGALFAFETLSATLGRAFEPYIISIIPLMLALFGDTNTDVREATQDAARVIMSKVSGHCVKLMLPTLLGGLDEKQWRTKKGSIELLGAMAFCAPRQLSLSLPTIIPQLTGVINDSHAQVKSAANTSLKRFGEVLENPEVKAIQSTLMKALADPTANIGKALTALLKTTFEHYLDAPSLALVMPIIDRGLRQRSSETKRKSVQIVGNMASLTESRDLIPYLTELMPLIHDVLVDPVPEARATAAKSLGTLVERLGETNFPDLVDQLLQTLRSDTSGVDRQGAAQGLSEVLSGLGMERLEGLLPDILNNTSSPRPYVREGFISLLVYLPTTFGHRFAPHLGRVIPPILNGLADNSEYVREASMRAGKMIIANYSNKAVDLLLPELEKGMLDASWRIRQSSISLTGELLYKVTGISGKVELEDEEAPAHSADNARKALLEALGQDKRDRVLATLYIVRQDAVGIVRQASIHIWKALVQNTPRTTREILPVLMQLLMSLLGSDEPEQQETASRTVGELCRKNGERIFNELIPILQKAITSSDARTKEGACLAFADVMAASNKDVIEDHEDAIISAIRTALVDSESSVRAAAARTFDAMQQYMGAKAIDQTIPTLLEAMRDPGETSETALQALQEVMSVRANSVFPVLIPTLIAQPITAFNARALGALVKVAGSALNRRLDAVLGALVRSREKEKSESIVEELDSAIESLLASVEDDDGIHQLQMLLIGWAKDPNPVRRATGCKVFGTFCQVNNEDASDYRVDWIRILVSLFDDSTEEVVAAAWEALEHFVKTVDKDELEGLVVPLRRAIEGTGSPGRHVSGFSRPKGVQSIVPVLLAGVLSGTQEQREQAAFGIGDLVQRTSEAAIKPYIIQLTGPLIRVISGQAIAPQIKSAILSTLTVLLEEVPQLVRPFHPQLTRTFVKSASDPVALSVRNRAAAGLGELMKHQPRVDPLITELIGGVRSGDSDVAPSVATALAAVCSSAGKNIGAAAKGSIIELIEEAFTAGRGETYNTAMAKIVAGLAKSDAENIRPIAETFLAAPTPPTSLVSLIILAIMEDAPMAFYDLDIVEDIAKKVSASVGSDSSGTARPAREARELMRKGERYEGDAGVQALLR